MVNCKPLRNMILVKPRLPETITKGGIIIPTMRLDANNNSDLVIADVIDVGPGYQTDKGVTVKPDVAVGDVIAFGGRGYTGTVIKDDDGTEYRLIKEVDVLIKYLTDPEEKK